MTYRRGTEPRLGLLRGGVVTDVGDASGGQLPTTLRELLERGPGSLQQVLELSEGGEAEGLVDVAACLPNPVSVRDFYAFERHVRDARAKRGLEMVPEWYEIPVFYFSNALAVRGPGERVWAPRGSSSLDFELEVGIVIGVGGSDIPAERAFDHVAGLVVLNDWSARDLQVREMKVGLGPSKGKDFALGIGPWLVTLDELEDRIDGERISLKMMASVNGVEVSLGNLADLHHTIPRLVEHASRGVTLYPGELLGTGTVGGGCLFEAGPGARFLQPGDRVELEVERLGVLCNQVVEAPL